MNQRGERSPSGRAVTDTVAGSTCLADGSLPAAAGSSESIGRRSPHNLPCHLHDPDLWFAESPGDLDRAKALCAECPVRRECLAGAMQRNEPCGVWGGEILLQGKVIPFKRGRGRPRIHVATTDSAAPLKSAS